MSFRSSLTTSSNVRRVRSRSTCGYGHRVFRTWTYFRWALQRFYEVKWNPATKQKQLDPSSGLVIREDRFLNAIWPQVGEIPDLHFGPAHGTFFIAGKPLRLEERFPKPKPKKKKP